MSHKLKATGVRDLLAAQDRCRPDVFAQLELLRFLQDPELFLEHNNYEPVDLLSSLLEQSHTRTLTSAKF